MIYPHSNAPDALGVMVLVIAPAVFLLCWLYNTRRLGGFKKARYIPKNITNKSAQTKKLLMICGIALALLLVLASYSAYFAF